MCWRKVNSTHWNLLTVTSLHVALWVPFTLNAVAPLESGAVKISLVSVHVRRLLCLVLLCHWFIAVWTFTYISRLAVFLFNKLKKYMWKENGYVLEEFRTIVFQCTLFCLFVSVVLSADLLFFAVSALPLQSFSTDTQQDYPSASWDVLLWSDLSPALGSVWPQRSKLQK